jgi:hypothetical protein
MLDVAKKYPKYPMAIDALLWVLSVGIETPESEQAVKMISQTYVADSHIVKFLPELAALPMAEQVAPGRGLAAETVLRAVLEKNRDNDVQGLATFYLAQNLVFQSQNADRNKPDVAASFLKQAEALYERVARDHGDVKDPNTTDKKSNKLRDLVEPELFEIRFLSVGKTVPEIEAEDLHGNTFKLSDYRGKVVLLDFWGNW